MLLTLDASRGEEENILRLRLIGEEKTIENIRWYLVGEGGLAAAFLGAWANKEKRAVEVLSFFLGRGEYWPNGLRMEIVEKKIVKEGFAVWEKNMAMPASQLKNKI